MTTVGGRLTVFLMCLDFRGTLDICLGGNSASPFGNLSAVCAGMGRQRPLCTFVTGLHSFRSDEFILAVLSDAGVLSAQRKTEFAFFRKQQRRMTAELVFVQLLLRLRGYRSAFICRSSLTAIVKQGNPMPEVHVFMVEGRTDEQKKNLMKGLDRRGRAASRLADCGRHRADFRDAARRQDEGRIDLRRKARRAEEVADCPHPEEPCEAGRLEDEAHGSRRAAHAALLTMRAECDYIR